MSETSCAGRSGREAMEHDGSPGKLNIGDVRAFDLTRVLRPSTISQGAPTADARSASRKRHQPAHGPKQRSRQSRQRRLSTTLSGTISAASVQGLASVERLGAEYLRTTSLTATGRRRGASNE